MFVRLPSLCLSGPSSRALFAVCLVAPLSLCPFVVTRPPGRNTSVLGAGSVSWARCHLGPCGAGAAHCLFTHRPTREVVQFPSTSSFPFMKWAPKPASCGTMRIKTHHPSSVCLAAGRRLPRPSPSSPVHHSAVCGFGYLVQITLSPRGKYSHVKRKCC